jgi:hypothetical protein
VVNSPLSAVAFIVDRSAGFNNSIISIRTEIVVVQDQVVFYVQDEEVCFLIWLPQTEVTVENAGTTFKSFEAESQIR